MKNFKQKVLLKNKNNFNSFFLMNYLNFLNLKF